MLPIAALQDAVAATTAEPTPLGLGPLLALFVVGSIVVVAWSRWVRPMNLALGYAATVAMWALSYVAMLQPGIVAGEALFAGALACVFAAGWLAGRRAPGEASGMSVGIVSATINLMVIGAFLHDEQGGSVVRPIAYVAGLYAASAVLGSLGDRLGRRSPPSGALPSPVTLMGIVATANILVMIVLGGLVTSYEAGLAVPDWPNSFGHNMLLYPVSEMKGGIFYEHAHRLFGMLVGATVLSFATLAFRSAVPTAARVLAAVLVALVVVQGILGGLRVTGNVTASMSAADLAPDTRLAVVHGMLGQCVFAIAMIATFACGGALERARVAVSGASSIHMLPAAALGALVSQLFLGASMRHLQVPPTAEAGAKIPAWALHGHITMALIAFVLVFLAGSRCAKATDVPVLRMTGKAAMHTVSLQLLLGIGALVAVLLRRGADVPWWEAVSTTAHQALGALLLAIVATLAVLSRQVRSPLDSPAPAGRVSASA
jgi:cytochrome c oxidase assembly protein subunit 15